MSANVDCLRCQAAYGEREIVNLVTALEPMPDSVRIRPGLGSATTLRYSRVRPLAVTLEPVGYRHADLISSGTGVPARAAYRANWVRLLSWTRAGLVWWPVMASSGWVWRPRAKDTHYQQRTRPLSRCTKSDCA